MCSGNYGYSRLPIARQIEANQARISCAHGNCRLLLSLRVERSEAGKKRGGLEVIPLVACFGSAAKAYCYLAEYNNTLIQSNVCE